MENIYESADMKKYIVKKSNPSLPTTNMELNSRTLVVGASGSGKTVWLANYIKSCPDTFHHIYICYKDMEPIYEMLKDKLKGSVTFYDNPSKIPPLNNLAEKYDKKDNILLVIDDWLDAAAKYPIFNDIYIRGRKYLTSIFLSQSFHEIPMMWRSQMTYLIILKLTNNSDCKLILTKYLLHYEIDTLLDFYRKATATKFHFLKISVSEQDVNKKYSHGYLDYLTDE